MLLLEDHDREAVAAVKAEYLAGRPPRSHGGIVGQVWRTGTGRQSNLARLMKAVHIEALDELLGRRAGALLGAAGSSDVLDAALVLLGEDGDEIWTSDPDDLGPLAEAAGTHLDIVPV